MIPNGLKWPKYGYNKNYNLFKSIAKLKEVEKAFWKSAADRASANESYDANAIERAIAN